MSKLDTRLQNLDALLLFVTTIFGLFFSLFSGILVQKEIAYGFLFLLGIGLVIPIYIGYVRGAIILDTLEERVRGWIYFLYGIILYILSIALWIAYKLMRGMGTVFEIAGGFLPFLGMFLLSYFLGGGRLRRWISYAIFRSFSSKPTALTDKIYDETGKSAVTTSIFLYIAFSFSMSSAFNITTGLIIIISISTAVVLFILSEREIRNWIKLLQFSEFLELEYRLKKSIIPTWIGKLFLFVSFSAIATYLLIFKWIEIFPKIALILTGSIGQIVAIISFAGSKATHVKKKEQIPKEVEAKLTALLAKLKIKT